MRNKGFVSLRRHIVSDESRPCKKKRKGEGEEAVVQKEWVRWARKNGLTVAHLNNGSRSKVDRIRLHAMGCTAGAADILIFDRLPTAPEVRFLALEFKSPRGVQSSAQKAWQSRCEAQGGAYHVVRSADEAERICLEYGL